MTRPANTYSCTKNPHILIGHFELKQYYYVTLVYMNKAVMRITFFNTFRGCFQNSTTQNKVIVRFVMYRVQLGVKTEQILIKSYLYFSFSFSSKTRVFLSSPRCLVNLTRKYIISVWNDKSKPLESMYFTSDEFTCKNFKFSNYFNIKSSGQN